MKSLAIVLALATAASAQGLGSGAPADGSAAAGSAAASPSAPAGGGSAATGAHGGSNGGSNAGTNGAAGNGGSAGTTPNAAPNGGSAGSGGGSAVVIQLPPEFGEPEVSAAASPADLKLGDRFTLFITATYGAGVEVNLPATVDLGDAFEIKRTSSEDHVRPDGKHVREWQLDVIAWDLGEIYVPPVPVTFTLGGHGGQLLTNAVPVRVTGVLGEADDPKLMRADAPPVMLKSRDWLWVWIGAGALVAIVAAVTFVTLRRRRRRRVRTLVGSLAPAMPRRIDMTSERALERLLAIEQSGVLERDGERKAGYSEMALVIRDYLGARFRFPTAERTTSELLRGLVTRAPARDHALVEKWLGKCDLVKYGGLRATAGQAGQALADARELVMQTTVEQHEEAAA